jgi:hypothetical protein
MGHIKEPKGVDFVIASDPLTDIARQEISEFIRDYKNKTTFKKPSSKKGATSKKPKSVQS